MADVTGFKLDKIRNNLALGVEKDLYDPTKFFIPYFNWLNSNDQTLPGFTRAQTLEAEKFIKGQEYGGNGITKNFPNEVYETLTKEVKKRLDSGEWFNDEFNAERIRQSKEAGGKGITDEHVREAASKIGDKIASDFENRFGRTASQQEIAAIFNGTNFSSTILANPDNAEKLLTTQEYEGMLKSFEEKLPIIEQANLELKNIGGSLSEQDLNKILSRGLSPERAEVLAGSMVEQLLEADAKTKLEQIKPQRLEAINQLEKDLSGGHARALTEDFMPAILSSLRSRGLVPGPELTNVLGEVTGKLSRERETAIAPLKTQTFLEAPEASFNFAMQNALAQGGDVNAAQNVLNQMKLLDKSQGFASTEGEKTRTSNESTFLKQLQLQMAMAGGTPQGPGALDYFLQALPSALALFGSFGKKGKS